MKFNAKQYAEVLFESLQDTGPLYTDLILIAVAIVIFDFVFFIAPLAAILLAVVLVFRPKWFKKFIDAVYKA